MSYAISKILKTGDRIFTVVYLSNILGVAETTVRRYIYNGKLKGKMVCGIYIIEVADILIFLELYNYYS